MSSFKRIFIGSFINIPDVENQLLYIKKEMGGLISGRWVKQKNLHITFKFIGEIPVERVRAVKESLEGIIDTDIKADLTLKGIGVFPNIKQPKILYIKVERSDVLNSIREEVEERLHRIGLKKEIKPFIPHITINRIKEVKPAQLMGKLEKFENYIFGYQNIISVNVIESILNHSGAEYTAI